MGAIREARRAGTTEDAIVTRVPTIRETQIVRGSSLSPVLGRSIPNALRSAFNPTAIAMPTRIPTADANRPTTNASTITESSTCRLLAPIARSSAISLERCATMIENVLKMMNAPTKSAMNANDEQRRPEEPQALLQLLRLLVGHRRAGDGLDALGEHLLDARAQRGRLDALRRRRRSSRTPLPCRAPSAPSPSRTPRASRPPGCRHRRTRRCPRW